MGNQSVTDTFVNVQISSIMPDLYSGNVEDPMWEPKPSTRSISSGINIGGELGLKIFFGLNNSQKLFYKSNEKESFDLSKLISISFNGIQSNQNVNFNVNLNLRDSSGATEPFSFVKENNIFKCIIHSNTVTVNLAKITVIEFGFSRISGSLNVSFFSLTSESSLITDIIDLNKNFDENIKYKFICCDNKYFFKASFNLFIKFDSFLIGYSTSKNLSNVDQLTYKQLYNVKNINKKYKVCLPINKVETLYIMFIGYIEKISVEQTIVKIKPKKICKC